MLLQSVIVVGTSTEDVMDDGLRPAASLTCCTRENTAGKNKGDDDNNIVLFTTVIVAAHRHSGCFVVVRFYFLSTERLGEYNNNCTRSARCYPFRLSAAVCENDAAEM